MNKKRTYYKFSRCGVPFPGVVFEGKEVVVNVLRGTWFGKPEIGVPGQITILRDPKDFAYRRANMHIDGLNWIEVSRTEFRKLLREWGYKKCPGRI